MAGPVDSLSVSALRECIARHYPGVQVSFERILTGKFNTSYFVRAGDEDLVLRIAPARDETFLFYERDMMRQEPGIHALLLERTTVPVAPIIAYDDSCSILPRDYLLMKRLPGRALSESPVADMDLVLRRTGECLAQAHALRAGTYGYIGGHRPMEPKRTWVEAFQEMWRKLIDDVVATGHYSQDEARLLLSLLDCRLPLFDRAVPSCLLHMDVWSQNLLVDDTGNLTGIVDWDRALWGDPEIEFAVLDYCGISEPAFWEGYGQPRDTSPEAQIRTVFYLLYEIQKYIVIRHGRNHDIAGARRYKAQTMQMAASLPPRS